MKKNFKMSIASILASELLEYGMLWGNELEWFLKLSVDGYIKFKNDKEYLEFEDMVLNYIENKSKKIIILSDINQNKSKIYTSINTLSADLNIPKSTIYNALKKNKIINQKYNVSYANRHILLQMSK